MDAALAHVIENGRAADTPLVMIICDWLIREHRAKKAATIWNRLTEAKRIPFEAVDVSAPSLTNGRFETEPSSHGFDWRIAENPGVTLLRLSLGQGIRILFSGRQSENCEPLFEFVPVAGNTRYQVRFSYRTSGISAGSGLRWRVVDADTGRDLSQTDSLASDTEAQSRVAFVTPQTTQLVRLALSYERTPGTTRIEGFIIIREVDLYRVD